MTPVDAPTLIAHFHDAHARTVALLDGLTGEQFVPPKRDIVNPFLWEFGHVAWFHERWVLRHLAGQPPILRNADALYDSIAIAHDLRWDLPLLGLPETERYVQAVLDGVTRRLSRAAPHADDLYFGQLTLFHEDMHGEAFTYMRQTLGYPRPDLPLPALEVDWAAGALPGDASVPGGSFSLGADPDEPFVFDNEKWAHSVELVPFRIARAPVTNAEFARFVDDGGYERQELWHEAGWAWRAEVDLSHPAYWSRAEDGGWQSRYFDRVVPLPPNAPVVHVSWYEADAYCRWAGRRLPTEAEWEAAASGEPTDEGHRLSPVRRRYPWGAATPTPQRANLDSASLYHGIGCIDVAALPASDSAFGCRQMIGNVWEWTGSTFEPYPGFVPDPYKEYSAPWFGTRKVLRGGCWATRGRMLRNTWRNFFTPDRNDVFAGFRTCALEA